MMEGHGTPWQRQKFLTLLFILIQIRPLKVSGFFVRQTGRGVHRHLLESARSNLQILHQHTLARPIVTLFAAASTGDDAAEMNGRKQRNDVFREAPMTSSSSLRRAKKVQRMLLLSLLGLTIIGRVVSSGLAMKLLHKVQNMTFLRKIAPLLRNNMGQAAKVGLLAACATFSIDALRTRRRQSKDPTSEWGRYARHPNLRGMATAYMLVVQVLPLAVLGRCFPRLQRTAGERFAGGLLRIGPLYIKMGQIISSQSQILPASWKPALEKLQDQVPAQSGAAAQSLAYSVWPGGEEAFHATFSSVDWNPIAAASLGQVHRAELKDGTRRQVALKFQRPFLREIYDHDFSMLKGIGKVVDRFFGSSAGSVGGVTQSWSDIFDSAERILYREIDYRDEASNCIRFANDFGLALDGKEAPEATALARNGKRLVSAALWLRTPLVYQNLTSEQVLVMEYVPAIKITDLEALQRANVTMADREYLAECLGRAYLRQFCANGFFSTDPHAGNLGVEILNTNDTTLPPCERVRVVFYDFGQAAELQREQSDGVLDMIGAIVDMDVDRSVQSFRTMGVLKDDADLDVVRAKIADNYRKGSLKVNRKRLRSRGYQQGLQQEAPASSEQDGGNRTSSTEDSTKFNDAQVMSYFTLPTEYAFVARALTQLDGVGKVLDASFDFISSAAPWIYEVKGADLYMKEEASKWIRRTFGN